MTHDITVRVVSSTRAGDHHGMWSERVIAPPKMATIVVNFLHRMNGARVKGLVITLEAPFYGDDLDRLKDELLQSARQEYEWYGEGVPSDHPDHNTPDEWTIDIIDPDGVLKWLGIYDTAVETFKQQKNDKPLRLPSANSCRPDDKDHGRRLRMD